MHEYMADFETTADNPEETRVWCWAFVELDNLENYRIGTDIDSFMSFFERQKGSNKVWFHNLKFDGEFILYWLFTHGYEHIRKREEARDKTFSTIIAGTGQFYAIEIYFNKKGKQSKKLIIYDSLKVIPFKVKEIPGAFGLEESKGEIDYTKHREIGYQPTEDEKEYILHDIIIVAKAMLYFRNQKLTKMTIGSNAMMDFKKMLGDFKYKKLFPELDYETDTFIRLSYRGGFCYVNKKYVNKEIGKGVVLDVNSLYPSRMAACLLPYGEPVFFNGRYVEDKLYPLYVQLFRCQFTLKEGYLPTLMFNNDLAFRPGEYLESSDGECVTLCLTSVDLKLFFEHYNVFDIEYISGFKFKAATGIFDRYLNKWFKVKADNSVEGGKKGLRAIAKLMLNNLYGKMATNPKVSSKIPYLEAESGSIKYKTTEKEDRKPVYIPMGTFITSYAREMTIRAAQSVYDRFIYADTDSLHLEGEALPINLEIDDVKLGAWAHEKTFTKAKFLMAKTYIEEVNGKLEITCAGMPEDCYKFVNFNNFSFNAEYFGKNYVEHVKGGIYLKPGNHTIREKKPKKRKK